MLITQKRVLIILFVISVFFVLRYGMSWGETISSCFLYPVLRMQQWCVDPVQQWMRKRAMVGQLQRAYDEVCAERDTLIAENIALKAECVYHHATKELCTFRQRYKRPEEHIAQILVRH